MNVRFGATHFFNTRVIGPSQARELQGKALGNPHNTLRKIGDVLIVDTGRANLESAADRELVKLGESMSQGMDNGKKTRLRGVYEHTETTGESLHELGTSAGMIEKAGRKITPFHDIMSI